MLSLFSPRLSTLRTSAFLSSPPLLVLPSRHRCSSTSSSCTHTHTANPHDCFPHAFSFTALSVLLFLPHTKAPDSHAHARVVLEGQFPNAGSRARQPEDGPCHVTVGSVACPYGAAVPPFRGRPCGAAACAPRHLLGSSSVSNVRSCALTLPLTLSPPFSRYLPAAGSTAVRRLSPRRHLSTRSHRRGKIRSHKQKKFPRG